MKRRLFAFILFTVWMMGAAASADIRVNNRNNFCLYAGSSEPALVFEQDKGNAKWRKSSGKIKITFNMENRDLDATIDAFDIVIYCKDVYEEIIYPQDDIDCDYIRLFTLDKTLKPGKTGYSGYCNIVGCKGSSIFWQL